jgi:hypothetical protein
VTQPVQIVQEQANEQADEQADEHVQAQAQVHMKAHMQVHVQRPPPLSPCSTSGHSEASATGADLPPTLVSSPPTTPSAPPLPPLECTICLSGDGPPFAIQAGCACRGSAGLAHVTCKIAAATSMQAEVGQCRPTTCVVLLRVVLIVECKFVTDLWLVC